MKRPIKYIFSLFFGLYFLFAGTGFNIINYCCHDCEVVGIENIALMSCHDNAHSHSSDCSHDSSDDFTCSDINHHPNGCHVLRLKVEIPSVVTTHVSFESASEIQLFYFTMICSLLSSSLSHFLLFDILHPITSQIQEEIF